MKTGPRFLSSELNDKPAAPGTAADFLGHLQERLGLDERTAVERLQAWLSTYEPGPAALERAGCSRNRRQTAAA